MKKKILDAAIPVLCTALMLIMFFHYEKIVEFKDGAVWTLNINGPQFILFAAGLATVILLFLITSRLKKKIFMEKGIKLKFYYDLLLWVVLIVHWLPGYHTSNTTCELDKQVTVKCGYGTSVGMGHDLSGFILLSVIALVITIRFYVIAKNIINIKPQNENTVTLENPGS